MNATAIEIVLDPVFLPFSKIPFNVADPDPTPQKTNTMDQIHLQKPHIFPAKYFYDARKNRKKCSNMTEYVLTYIFLQKSLKNLFKMFPLIKRKLLMRKQEEDMDHN